MPPKRRILILTAAFGEGHNSAAKNLALAIGDQGADVRVIDPCILSGPQFTALVEWGYRFVTTHSPRLWEAIYKGTDQCDFRRKDLPFLQRPEQFLAEYVRDFQPDAIICTYPIYPYFLERIFAERPYRCPVFTVVTDSIEINASWLRAPCDYFLVTDQTTCERIIQYGISRDKIIVTGFAVNPLFADLLPVGNEDTCDPFRILYLPTAKKALVRQHSRALLDVCKSVQITIVMGKNFRILQSRAKQIKTEYPGRVCLLGWTRKIPYLMNSHHLVVGKAGGATVHEAIAARCPMLVHHLVPGQEEGNLRLLEKLKAGHLAETSEELSRSLLDLLTDQATKWRSMKRALCNHNRNDGSKVAAQFILSKLLS